MATTTQIEKEMAAALAPEVPAPLRRITADEYAAALTRLALSAEAAVLANDKAVDGHLAQQYVRALSQELLRASEWILDAEQQLMLRDKGMVVMRNARSCAIACESFRGANDEDDDDRTSFSDESTADSADELYDALLFAKRGLQIAQDSLSMCADPNDELVYERDPECEPQTDAELALALANELEHELTQCEARNAELIEEVESLERLVVDQREELASAHHKMRAYATDRLSLRSEVERLEAIKSELEQVAGDLSARVWSLEVTEADLRHQLFAEIEDKMIVVGEYEARQRELEELTEQLRKDLEAVFNATQQQHGRAGAHTQKRPAAGLKKKNDRGAPAVTPKASAEMKEIRKTPSGAVLSRRPQLTSSKIPAPTGRVHAKTTAAVPAGSTPPRAAKPAPVVLPASPAPAIDRPTAASRMTKLQPQTPARAATKKNNTHVASTAVAATMTTTKKKPSAKAPAPRHWR